MSGHCLTGAHDETLVQLVNDARRRVMFVSPGVTDAVALALVKAWGRLGVNAVQLVLDVDPEVCRLGYGTLTGIKLLQEKAGVTGAFIRHQPGVRIGLLICDERTLIFTPTPQLIEDHAGSTARANAVMLDHLPAGLELDLGLRKGKEADRVVGVHPLDEVKLKRVERELKDAPPIPFDLARQVRVYTTHLRFVELEMKGCFISRKKVKIPAFLLGTIRNPQVKRNLETHFNLVEDGTVDVPVQGGSLTEVVLRDKRKQIEERFLISLQDYGSVVLRSRKAELEKAVDDLKADVAEYAKGIRESLKKRIDDTISVITSELLPVLKEHPPEEWEKFHSGKPTSEFIRKQLDHELRRAFGHAQEHVDKMSVNLVFKDVAYESLQDTEFVRRAQHALRGMALHTEYQAAPVRGHDAKAGDGEDADGSA